VRYLAIDAIRALAALSVLFTHWAQTTDAPAITRLHTLFRGLFWSATLHPGVIAFIVVSGFCIHLPNVGKPVDWRLYARRRFWRIAPVFWAGVALGLLALTTAPSIGIALALALRLTFLSEFGSPLDLALGNAPLYTVITEMWLYAAYPLLLLARRRLSWPTLLLIGLGLQLAAYVGLPHVIADFDFASTGVWALWAFWLLGAWSAERVVIARQNYSTNIPRRLRLWLVVVAYVGSNLVILPWPFVAELIVRSLALAVAVAVILHDLMLREAHSLRRSLLARGLAWIGERSYSLYATHAPILAVLPAISVFPVALAVYALIEWPSHRFARRARVPHVDVLMPRAHDVPRQAREVEQVISY